MPTTRSSPSSPTTEPGKRQCFRKCMRSFNFAMFPKWPLAGHSKLLVNLGLLCGHSIFNFWIFDFGCVLCGLALDIHLC